MWNINFEDRLASWANLRDQAQSVDLTQQLTMINNWWFRAPISNHYLHIDDIKQWPDPWDLLADNIYCEVARAAGIVYTISMISNENITDCNLINTDQGTFVSVNNGQYILNYAPNTLLNTEQRLFNITKIINTDVLQKNIS